MTRIQRTDPQFSSIDSQMLGIRRIGPNLTPDPSRVLLRPFRSGNRKKILKNVSEYVMRLSDDEVERELSIVIREFGHRHNDLESFFQNRFVRVNKPPGIREELTLNRKTLIGSFFCHEYSIEAASLFNPSIVRHPDQTNLPTGALRFILSLRATGEGHISSVTFRTGSIDAGNRINIMPPKTPLREPDHSFQAPIEKVVFTRKMQAMGFLNDWSRKVVDRLPDEFEYRDLLEQIESGPAIKSARSEAEKALAKKIRRLAESDRELVFDSRTSLSQRVLFPFAPDQRNGIEDARFVEFHDEDGNRTYYATYTAFDGKHVRPQLLSTPDFLHFQFINLTGSGIRNKGMSLFPRKFDGRFLMLSRQDDRNILMMSSDDIRFWEKPRIIIKPLNTWEMLKIGTCSSPIETEKGWLVLSHGVGPMRKYGIGAFLLDLDDPSKVLGRSREPLLVPNESEREGYVPNVLYTCGALLHERKLIIPYALSDSSTRFAVVDLNSLLDSMQR